jgi:CRISPR-associated protein Cas1
MIIMVGRVVEIADEHRHVFIARGLLVVRETDEENTELGRVPLDDIDAVIANAHGLSYTNNLLVALAERGIPFVLCAANHNPVGMLWPVAGNHQQAKRFDAQLAAKKPLQKRLWADIVRAKLHHQASVLAAVGKPSEPLAALSRKVRSGDPDNIEAQGARRYWSLLFGTAFRRDRQGGGENALLNYGYTVLRAAAARAVVAAGLHPTLGIHHANEGNPMRLVDDLIEPFRPLMDFKAWEISRAIDKPSVTPETKRALVQVLFSDLQTDIGATPAQVCLQRLATSLAQVYVGERRQLDLPLPTLPLEFTIHNEPF